MKGEPRLCAVYGVLVIVSWFEAFALAEIGMMWAFYLMMAVLFVSFCGFMLRADQTVETA